MTKKKRGKYDKYEDYLEGTTLDENMQQSEDDSKIEEDTEGVEYLEDDAELTKESTIEFLSNEYNLEDNSEGLEDDNYGEYAKMVGKGNTKETKVKPTLPPNTSKQKTDEPTNKALKIWLGVMIVISILFMLATVALGFMTNSMNQSNAELNNSLTQMQEEYGVIDEVTGNLAEKENTLNESEEGVLARESELDELSKELEKKQTELTKLEEDLGLRVKEVDERESNITKLNEEIKGKESELDSKTKELQESESSINAEISKYNSVVKERDTLLKEKGSLENQVSNQESTIKEQEGLLSDMQKELDANNVNVKELETLQKQIDKLEGN